jgi:hypothetical protein
MKEREQENDRDRNQRVEISIFNGVTPLIVI